VRREREPQQRGVREAGAEEVSAERERTDEQVEHARQGERGVRERWKRSQTNRRTRMDRRERKKVSRGRPIRRGEEEEGTDFGAGGED